MSVNLKDFPRIALQVYNLDAVHPDIIISVLADLHISTVLDAARLHRASLKNLPPFSPDDYLNCRLHQQLPETLSRRRRLTRQSLIGRGAHGVLYPG
ncbi:hypothetical protein SJI19_16505 [Acerihabitans sp. TG2]|uniref:hypothetical protein n=1 Tax=Acerihabitans sp. TG2 TaxID=3096008 RepID=UPI002B23BC55|nr:hypothetical protein [Acerihabitans sp. TG2]MEA9392127.1 hypothetical protein [Acerihabitans sp. TG2]